jgi:LIVCS family branched-chain amino acid:cation transporter
VLAFTITFACLKTAIGLVSSCAEMFLKLIPGKLNYRGWAMVFTLFSFIISNVGLTAIIKYAVPVLMLIYPLCVTLIILALCEKLFGGSRYVYICVTIFTAVPAVVDFLKALGVSAAAEFGSKVFPFFDLSLGWVVPAIIGLVLGVVLALVNKGKSGKAAA